MAFSATFDLTSLDGTNGFRIDGLEQNARFGFSVSDAGDFNGDGIDDFIVGGFNAGPQGYGAAYVILGRDDGTLGANGTFDLASIDGTNGLAILGTISQSSPGRFAQNVADAGDINGDGIDDVIVSNAYFQQTGEPFVVFGDNDGVLGSAGTIRFDELDASTGLRFRGAGGTGYAVGGGGDVNGDGLDDFVVGTLPALMTDEPGRAFVVSGSTNFQTGSVQFDGLNGANGFRINGEEVGDFAGHRVDIVDDVNGDGRADLLVTADRATGGGKAYVVFGTADFSIGGTGALDLSTVNGTNGFVIEGFGGALGFSASEAGDVNGDGINDLFIGSRGEASFVVFGGSQLAALPGGAVDVATLDGTDGFRINGVTPGDRTGAWLNSAGDVNGDGVDDVIVGGYLNDPGGRTDAGAAYVVFGVAGGSPGASGILDLSTLDGTNGFLIEGLSAGDIFGRAVSGAGDVNGDGIDDIVVGASQADPDGLQGAGSAYVIYGQQSVPPFNIITGTPLADSLTGTVAADQILGLAGDDALYGGDGADMLSGGDGNDFIRGDGPASGSDVGDGADTIYGGAGDDIVGANGGDDLVFGGDGADRLWGADGNDTLSGGLGTDLMVGGSGSDLAYGGLGNDTLSGMAGSDSLRGGDGDDALYGGDGADQMFGQTGADALYGGDGADLLSGGDGNDFIRGDGPASGSDAGDGADTIYGGAGDDIVGANGGDDLVFGGDGADRLWGADGDDTLSGGLGDDEIFGGSGADVFGFRAGFADNDTVADFTGGVDRLDFSALPITGTALDSNGDGIVTTADAAVTITPDGDLVLSIETGTVTVIGVQSLALTDFVF